MEFHEVKNLKDLALILGCNHSQLSYYAFLKNDNEKYKQFVISKKGGGERTIATPLLPLKHIQKSLSELLENYYEPRASVHGYVTKRSIVSNANKHTKQKLLARVDIRDFFPSITQRRIIGLFASAPFKLDIKVAVALSKLVTFRSALPQGAPTSPIISNLICRRLDSRVGALARECRCYFTRYADDFFFSTNHSSFPELLIFERSPGEAVVGEELQTIFEEEGFRINESKVSIKDQSQRQIVTGIVVNEKLNVPRRFVREVRAMLYSWERFGYESAEKHWVEHHDYRNRPSWKSPRFNWVLRGKIDHIGAVKGKSDSTFLLLAKRLAALDDNYTLDPKLISDSIAEEIIVYTEGKTDAVHIGKAIEHFHSKGEFSDLKLTFSTSNHFGEGDSNLKKLCEALAATLQRKLTVTIFDSDVPNIVSQMTGSSKNYKDHGNNVFSLVIPNPTFRGNRLICIEHCYNDADLLRRDSDGRRLYLIEEFDSKFGFHKENKNVYKANPHKKTLIVDSDVVDINAQKNIALSKARYAELVGCNTPPFHQQCFAGFRPLLQELQNLRNSFVQS